MLVLTKSFIRNEFSKVSKFFSREDVEKVSRKIQLSGIEMGSLGFKGCKILKGRVGGKPAGRIIVFLQVQKEYVIPVVIRLKRDKIFGVNLALSNKKAKKVIVSQINSALLDLKHGDYEKVGL